MANWTWGDNGCPHWQDFALWVNSVRGSLGILLLLKLSEVLGSTLSFAMMATVTSANMPRNMCTKEYRIIKVSSILLLKLTAIWRELNDLKQKQLSGMILRAPIEDIKTTIHKLKVSVRCPGTAVGSGQIKDSLCEQPSLQQDNDIFTFSISELVAWAHYFMWWSMVFTEH